jgi:hypothetical protein
MVKVVCSKCQVEMVPSEDSDGQPERMLPLATISALGKVIFQIAAIWYVCPTCERSACVLPDWPNTVT